MRFSLLVYSFVLASATAATLSAQAHLWEAHVLRADSLFKANPTDTAAILSALLESEQEWYYIQTDTGIARVFNPVGEPLWLEDVQTIINEDLVYRTLEIRRTLLGDVHPHIARSLERIGMLKVRYSQFDAAIETFEKALATYEATLGPESPELGRALHCLGFCHRYFYRFEKAEKYLRRSLRVREQGLSPDDPITSYSLNGLAHLYWNLGLYHDAEQLYKRAYKLCEKAYGPNDMATVGTKSNILRLLASQGRFDEMQQIATLSDFATLSLPLMYFSQLMPGQLGNVTEAIKAEMELTAQRLGSNDPYHIALVYLLAKSLHGQGQYDEAEQHYKDAMSIWHSTTSIAFGMDIADVQKHLADLYRETGRATEAITLYDQAIGIREQLLRPTHPRIAEILEERSRCHLQLGNHLQALADAERALTIRRNHYDQSFAVLSEYEALSTINLLRASVSNSLSCFLHLPHPDSAQIARASDLFLAAKGRVSDGMIRRGNLAFFSTDSADEADVGRYLVTKGYLSNLYLRSISRNDAQQYQRQVDSLNLELQEMESALARRNAEFNKALSTNAVTAARIKAALPDGVSLVEFLRYDRFDGTRGQSAPSYLAIVFARNREVTLHDLGNAQAVDSLITAYQSHMAFVAKKKVPLVGDEADYLPLAQSLYRKIWKPLNLTDTTIFLAPDGPLNLIAFGGLVDETRTYLIERFALHTLTSARDLLHEGVHERTAQGLLALGNPDFHATAEERKRPVPKETRPAPSSAHILVARNVLSDCGLTGRSRLAPLLGSETEVIEVRKYWKQGFGNAPAKTFIGGSASEEMLKRHGSGNRIIHLATHAYFLGNDCDAEGTATALRNPLLRSGLFLAGAAVPSGSSDTITTDDGILTALEVSAMDLHGTELVVLSACETGLGKLEQGEGVFGLRRAFQRAGAKTVISALWQVVDHETMKFMKSLYASLASRQRNTSLSTYPELMQRAAMKHIQEARMRDRTTHPFNWAAFVATGDWRIR